MHVLRTAQTFGKAIISNAEAQSELCLGGAILVVTQHWLCFVYSSVEIQQVWKQLSKLSKGENGTFLLLRCVCGFFSSCYD